MPSRHVDTGIFLGHEFETHYIRLVPLYESALMPQSDKQTVEDQGSAGYDQRNSDIRNASENGQPCADIFSESVDDQPCADNVGTAN